MPKLPSISDLGNTPRADATMPVADYGAAATEVKQTGAILAKGVDSLAEGVANYGINKQRFDYAKAKSYLLTGIVDRNEATKVDIKYGPDDTGKSLPNRHAESVWGLQNQAAAMVPEGPMRERFMQDTAPEVQRSLVGATNHARALEGNANVAWTQEQGVNVANKVVASRASGDEDTASNLVDAHMESIDGLVGKGYLTPEAAFKMKQEWAHQTTTADYLHRADTDPQGVINELRAAPGSGDAITNRIIQVEGTRKNGASSASGTGQFIDSTWGAMLRKYHPEIAQDKSDADLKPFKADRGLAREMVDKYRQENSSYLQGQGAPATPGAQYLAHFLGPAGAAAVLKADPGQPVADALAQAVGDKKAQEMIAANPSILQGQLAGSVAQWADKKMGGVSSSGGSLGEILRPDVKEEIITRAQSSLEKQTTLGRAAFETQVNNAQSEAYASGAVSKPIALTDFIAHYGADAGRQKYAEYDETVQTGRTVNAMATMSADDRNAVVEGLKPQGGDPQFALKSKAYEVAQKAAASIASEMSKDPAGYAVSRLPASKEAYQAFQNAANGSDQDRSTAAQNFARVTMTEQAKVGVPDAMRTVVPKAYADHLTGALEKATNAEDPQARIGLVGQVQREAQMWGDYWPQVMRQMAPQTQPIVRAIAAGADPTAMTRLLSLGKDENPAKILKEQNETKSKDLTTALNETLAPFRQSLIGRQMDRDYPAYYGLAEKLSALYVRDGDSAGDAATKAFNALIGNRYDFRDTYRIPKSAGVSADDIQAGAQAARGQLDQLGVKPAIADIPGLSDNRADSLPKFARDGVWVTSHDNSGLQLVYGDKFVRKQDGTPFSLSWQQLGKLGGSPEVRKANNDRAVLNSSQTP